MATKHLQNIYDEEELSKEATSSKMELVQKEGGSEVTPQHSVLMVIIALVCVYPARNTVFLEMPQ